MIRIEDRLRRTERNLCNEAADEIERLRELVAAGKVDRYVVDELVDENLRLRKLLRQCQPFVDRLQPPTLDLSVEIAEELR